MSQPPVTIYTTGWCPYCQRAKQLLAQRGLAYTEIDVEATSGARTEMETRSGRRTVPQVFIGTRHVGGCDDLHALDNSGELQRIIEGE